jgi:hypothetical protein
LTTVLAAKRTRISAAIAAEIVVERVIADAVEQATRAANTTVIRRNTTNYS